MQHLPGTQPPGVTAASVGHTPYGLGIGIGPGVPVPREERRRFRRVREEEGAEGAEGDAKNEDGDDDAKQLSENGKEGSVRGDSAQDDGHAKPAEEPGMDIDEGDYETPALRRSNRRPGASTHRRPSPSPTPSSSSSTPGTRYRPILPDLDLAHNVFAERATKDWCQALASGGGQTVQGPGVNPASAGQVMMGGTGGMQREGEVVADFLYAIRVKGESRVGCKWVEAYIISQRGRSRLRMSLRMPCSRTCSSLLPTAYCHCLLPLPTAYFV
jgi:hypothetical protein